VTDRAAFVNALHATPDDDASWLIFADWLDNHRAEGDARAVRLFIVVRHSLRAWLANPPADVQATAGGGTLARLDFSSLFGS
jgi:uncharacterized protein (TIGR02996 family)